MKDIYRVLKSTSEAEIKVKGSRFIARAHPVSSPEQVSNIIADARRAEHDATHHCTAYRLGSTGNDSRFNDDGEPSGTAGRPILRQIDALELTNTLVIVTRYYGGTKLGTGGLIRAYGAGAREALAAATIDKVVRRKELIVVFEYPDTSAAMHVVQRFDTETLEHMYGEDTRIRLAVRLSQVEEFLHEFEDALSGRGKAIVPKNG